MSDEFDRDIRHLRHDLRAARAALLGTVEGLDDADLARSRRGGWPVGRVLQHIVDGEWNYARLVAGLRDGAPIEPPERPAPPDTVAEVRERLRASRAALLASLDGVDEETFYALQPGRDAYSVMSVLENVVHHDGEHCDQVGQILRAAR